MTGLEKIIEELENQSERILRALRELKGQTEDAARYREPTTKKTMFNMSPAVLPGAKKRRRGLTPAGRKALSEKMKARWAEKKAEAQPVRKKKAGK